SEPRWPTMLSKHRFLTLAGRTLFVLWCLSWLPTIVLALTENFNGPEQWWERVTRLACAVNVAGFYVGGWVWLARRSRGAGLGRQLVVALTLFTLSSFGPMILPVCGSILRPDLHVAGSDNLTATKPQDSTAVCVAPSHAVLPEPGAVTFSSLRPD